MAQAEHLPLSTRTYDRCLSLEQVVHNCSHSHKYALGAALRDGARRALTLVVRAKARRDNAPGLLPRRQEREKRQVLRRPGQNVKACPTGQSLQHASTWVGERVRAIGSSLEL